MAVWGQNMASPQAFGIHWFFFVYWLTVLVAAQILQKARVTEIEGFLGAFGARIIIGRPFSGYF